eukprot:c10371_g1_i1 orf=68-658(-)
MSRRGTNRLNERDSGVPLVEGQALQLRRQPSVVRKATDIVTSLLTCIAIPIVCGAVMMANVNPSIETSMLKKPMWARQVNLKGVCYGAFMACYVMMGSASWIVFKKGTLIKKRTLLGLYALQLLMNLVWFPLAFSLHYLGLALIDSYLLLIVVMLCTYGFGNVHMLAGFLMFPYSLCTYILAAYSTHLFILNRSIL